jgi:hypothetical protein
MTRTSKNADVVGTPTAVKPRTRKPRTIAQPTIAPEISLEPQTEANPLWSNGEKIANAPLTLCEHDRVIRTMDRMFPYRCLQCDTRLTEGALPNVVIVQPEDTGEPEETGEPETDQDTDEAVETTWTTAPVDYDGFGTVTIDDGVALHCGKFLREVATPRRHVQWQRDRYGSGLHVALDEAAWDELRGSPGFLRENGSEPFAGRADYQDLIADATAELAALPTAIGSMAPKIPAPMSTAAAELVAMVPEDDQAALAARLTVLPALTSTDPRVQYLYDLMPQGEAAILEALRTVRLKVHLPRTRTERQARTGQAASSRKMDPEKARDYRARRAAGESQASLVAFFGISKTLAGNIERRRVWKDA